jgi:hypothetical protein
MRAQLYQLWILITHQMCGSQRRSQQTDSHKNNLWKQNVRSFYHRMSITQGEENVERMVGADQRGQVKLLQNKRSDKLESSRIRG